MASRPSFGAIKALQIELKVINDQPMEGFMVEAKGDNLFEWTVAIFGPPGTLYEGGYFKAHMKFPSDYPYSPPTVKFLSKMWHPNIYENGDVCISILHPPTEDPHSGELPSERWNPTQSVRTILLSIISLLNEPNTFSPANVDASVMFRKWKDSSGEEKDYENIIRKQVALTKLEAIKDGVRVPITLEDYCLKSRTAASGGSRSSVSDVAAAVDYYDDDDYLDDDDDEDEEEDEDGDDDVRSHDNDSGNWDEV